MNNPNQKFFNEIREMIAKRQYNEGAVDKLLNIIGVSKVLAKQEKNEEVKKLLLYISVVGEALIKELYEVKNKR